MVECCGTCDHYAPKLVCDEDGAETDEEMGVCERLDAIVWFDTRDCEWWTEGEE